MASARSTTTKRPLLLFFGTVVGVVVGLTVAWIIAFTVFLGLLIAVIVAVGVMWTIARTGRPGRARKLEPRSPRQP